MTPTGPTTARPCSTTTSWSWSTAWWEPLSFVLPPTRPGAEWHAEIDSYDPAAPAGAGERHAGDQVTVGPRSVVVLSDPRRD